MRLTLLISLILVQTSLLRAATPLQEQDLYSKKLILPEPEQFQLGIKLFREKDKKIAAWKAFETFLQYYPKSPLAGEAQFLLAESIFIQSYNESINGHPPDESAWKLKKQRGLKKFRNAFVNKINEIKYIGSSNESAGSGQTPKDRASFSEAIQHYQLAMIKRYKKSGLTDTALFRTAECYYNLKDYPFALKTFKECLTQYPQSYLASESILGIAQCYIPAGDFKSAESEIQNLTAIYPRYKQDPRVLSLLGLIQYQTERYEEAAKNLAQVDSAESAYYAGLSLFKMGRSIEAIAHLRKVIEKYKEGRYVELASFFMAESIYQSKNYSGAAYEYQNFITLYPQSQLKEAALFRVGAASLLNKESPTARENFVAQVKAFPSGEFAPLAMYFTAESYRLVKQYKEASFSYSRLISALPNAPITASARFKLGVVTLLQENNTGALDAFKRFIDWDPMHPWVPYTYFLMGDIYSRLGKAEDAVNSYQQTFDRAPKTILAESAMAFLNRTHYQKQSYSQITSGYTYILKSLLPSDTKWRAVSLIYLGDAYYRQQLYQEAISMFQSVLALYPNTPNALHAHDGLYWCYFKLGEFDKAQSEREKMKAVKLPEGTPAPEMSSGSFDMANALFNQKKYLEAATYYNEYMRDSPASPNTPDALYYAGLCYYRMEYYTQAISAWEELQKKYPKHERAEEAAVQVADTYFRAQKYDNAVQTYKKIISEYPKNARAQEAALRIAQSYYNAANDPQAVEEFDQYIRKYPRDPKLNETFDLIETSLDRVEARTAPQNVSAQKAYGFKLLKNLVKDFSKTPAAEEAQFRIAKRLFQAKEYAEAVQEFENFSVSYPNSQRISESLFYKGEALYTAKKYEDCVNAFQIYIQNFPGTEFAAPAAFHLATAHYNLQNFDAAIQTYQTVFKQHPKSEYAQPALFNLALTQKKILKLDDAADSYLKLAAAFPEDPQAKTALLEAAKIKLEQKDFDASITTLRELDFKITGDDERKPEIAYLWAEASLGKNDPQEAVRLLKSILTPAQKNEVWKLEALRKLGDLYEKDQNWKDAIQSYEDGSRLSKEPALTASFKARAKYLKETYLAK